MAYKRKNKKKDQEQFEENKKFVQDYLERFDDENELIGDQDENDWDEVDRYIDENEETETEEKYQIDNDHVRLLAEEIFPVGSNMEEYMTVFMIGYKRAIHDVNNGNIDIYKY